MQTNEQKISELVEPITDYMQNCGLELETQQQITEQIRFALSKMANWKDDVIINIRQKLFFLRDLYNETHND